MMVLSLARFLPPRMWREESAELSNGWLGNKERKRRIVRKINYCDYYPKNENKNEAIKLESYQKSES